MKATKKRVIRCVIISLLLMIVYSGARISSEEAHRKELLAKYSSFETTTSGVIYSSNLLVKNTVDQYVEVNNVETTGITLEEFESGEEFEPYYMEVKVGWLNVRSTPDKTTDDNIVGHLNPCDIVWVIGEVGEDFVKIDYTETDDGFGYVSPEYLQEILPEEETYSTTWTGTVLNRHDGKVPGPSGNETFYNLNMSKCIYYMNCLGYYGRVWTRSDGVKMFGNYVMVAADLSIRPKGSLVETTLGTGIVVDTGEFVNWDSTRLDVAVTWK